MEQRKLHFIVNPKAGRGKALAAWRNISNAIGLTADEIGISLVVTQTFVGEQLPTEQFDTDTILVSVGGDGSAHYAAAQALRLGLPLAIVPGGTGNDMVRNLGLPTDLRGILQVLLTGEPVHVDVIRVNEERAFNLAGYGIDAEVVHWIETHPWLKRIGRLGYGIVVPIVLWKHRHFHVSVETEDSTVHHFPETSIFAVANGALFGGGMKIAPMASPHDGQLNLVVANGLSKLAILRLFPRIYRGTHVTHPRVECLTGSRFIVDFKGPETAAEYDGEAYPLPLRAKIEVSKDLRVLLPLLERG